MEPRGRERHRWASREAAVSGSARVKAAHLSLITHHHSLVFPPSGACAFGGLPHRKKFRLRFCLGKTFAFAFPLLKSLVWNRASCDHTITANRNLRSCRSFTADH